MSEKVRFEAVRDPRTDLASTYAVEVRDGPANISYTTVAAASQNAFGNQSFVFNPAPNQGIGRYCTIHWEGKSVITFSGAVAGPTVANVCLRAWPIMSCLSNLQVTVNSTTLTMPQPNRIALPWSRIANPATNQTGVQSTAPTAPDWYSNYSDIAIGEIASPFRADGARGEGVYQPRVTGIVKIVESAAATNPGTLEVQWDITEPITCSPFIASADDKSALYGIGGNFRVQYTFTAEDLNRVICTALFPKTANAVTITGIVSSIKTQEIQAQFYTPTNDSFLRRLPNQWYNAPSYQPQSFSRDIATADKIATFNVNSFAIGVVPRLLVIWAIPTPTGTFADSSTSGVCAPITKIQLSFLNKQNLLSSASQQQLYQASVNAGLHATWAEFAGLPLFDGARDAAPGAGDTVPAAYSVGCPVVIDVSTLDLPDDVAPGVVMSTLIGGQVTVDASNFFNAASGHNAFAGASQNFTLYVMPVIPGFLQLGAGGSAYVEGGLTGADVASARKSDIARTAIFDKMAMSGTLAGGSFFSDFASGFGKAAEIGLPLVAKFAGAGGASMNATGARSLRERLMK